MNKSISSSIKLWIFASLFAGCFYFHRAGCFNLDTKDAIIFDGGKPGYFFGFSIALHKHKSKRWLVVGAPRGNDTANGFEPRHGAVYKCDLSLKTRTCVVMEEFDSLSSIGRLQQFKKLTHHDYRKGQWMGATVRSAKNYILACAPRLAWPGTVKIFVDSDEENKQKYYPVGKCEVVDSTRNKNAWIWNPCQKIKATKNTDMGFCSLGFDANFNSDMDTIIAGAPSSLDFRGRLLATNLYSKTAYLSSTFQMKPESIMGYSAVLLKLPGKSEDAFVGGAPAGDNRIGKVVVYKHSGILLTLLNPSKQIGSYFGGTLAVADVNGDGNEDLLVGAPFFATNNNEGAVYVYINTGNRHNLFNSPMSLFGDSQAGARFGMSIANAGDLNLDKFQDVVIGAPYEGRGAVYVYLGSRHGLQSTYSQKILPDFFGIAGLRLRAFGSALSSGVDMDGNSYPDLAIGSFLSDKVVYLRSRPVVSIKARITLQYVQINQNSKKQTCVATDGRRHICLQARICFNAGGKGVPRPIGISYEFAVDEEQPVEKRAFLLEGSSRSFRQSKTVDISDNGCFNHSAYLMMKPRNIDSPLVFKVNFNYKPKVGCKLCPVMKPGSVEAMASYTKNCGADLVCSADLSVTGKIVISGNKKEITSGATQTLSLVLFVKNSKESAYLSKIVAFCPAQLSIIGVHLKLEEFNHPWTLVYFNSTHNKLAFNTGNPIGPGEMETYEITFSVESILASVRRLMFEIEAVTSSKDLNLANNKMHTFVDVVVLADMTISGVTKPERVTYKENMTAKEAGPKIIHSFLIQNKGPSTVHYSKVQIKFPEKFKGQYLLNLLSTSVKGPINCKIDKSVFNPLGLKVKQGKSSSKSRKRRDIEKKLDCVLGECRTLQCEVGRLQRGESVGINLQFTLVEKTFSESIIKNSMITVTAKVFPHSTIRQPTLHFPDKVELTVQILAPASHQSVRMKQKSVPWWIILVSVIAGLVLVAGIIFVLHKGGFFKRKQRNYSFSAVPTATPESRRFSRM